ncbi:MAG: dTDP-glucose 4,6-dehydratase [Pseudomonadales bacterium]
MASLLVTGAAGFIGSNFVRYWLQQHPVDRVVALDALTYAGHEINLNDVLATEQLSFVCGDICNTELVTSLLVAHDIDTIVHFAAESHVDRSITGPAQFIETNVVGTHSLLQAARDIWLTTLAPHEHRFHHISTDEVYGTLEDADPAFTEQNLYQPNSPYAASKAASDHLVRAYQHTYGLQVTTSNCSNNYGPYHLPEKLIPLCIINLLQGKALPVYGSGKNVRDWLYVEDHCRAIDLILQRGKVGETYNVGGNNEWKNIDVVHLLCDLLDKQFSAEPKLRQRYPQSHAARGLPSRNAIEFVTDRAGHDWRYAIDATKIGRELGFTPQESFASGMEKTLHWFLHNADWWQHVQEDSVLAT